MKNDTIEIKYNKDNVSVTTDNGSKVIKFLNKNGTLAVEPFDKTNWPAEKDSLNELYQYTIIYVENYVHTEEVDPLNAVRQGFSCSFLSHVNPKVIANNLNWVKWQLHGVSAGSYDYNCPIGYTLWATQNNTDWMERLYPFLQVAYPAGKENLNSNQSYRATFIASGFATDMHVPAFRISIPKNTSTYDPDWFQVMVAGAAFEDNRQIGNQTPYKAESKIYYQKIW